MDDHKNLMDECRDSSDVGESIDLGFRSLSGKVNALQQKWASMKGDTVLSPAHHSYITNMINDLASAFSAAPAAIVENTSTKLPEVEVDDQEKRDDDADDDNDSDDEGDDEPSSKKK